MRLWSNTARSITKSCLNKHWCSYDYYFWTKILLFFWNILEDGSSYSRIICSLFSKPFFLAYTNHKQCECGCWCLTHVCLIHGCLSAGAWCPSGAWCKTLCWHARDPSAPATMRFLVKPLLAAASASDSRVGASAVAGTYQYKICKIKKFTNP